MVRLNLPFERIDPDIAPAQIASARAAGCSVSGYAWCYPDASPEQTVRDALAVAHGAGVTLPVLWLDCEEQTGPSAEWIAAAIAECRRLGTVAGVYSGMWWLRSHIPDYGARFGDVPLWLAQYSGGPTLDDVELPPGLPRSSLAGKQYDDQGIDRDVFRSEYTEV